MYIIRVKLSQDGSYFVPCGPLGSSISLATNAAHARRFTTWEAAEEVRASLPDTIRGLSYVIRYNPGH